MLNPQNLTPGNEQYEQFRSSRDFRRGAYYQYGYRHTDGELFSCVCKTLEECRRRRDKWLKNKAL